MSKPSKIFIGYRALGFVSNDVPLSLRYILRRKEHLVVTVVGKSFHTYGCSRLNLLSVSNPHPDEITCLASDAYLVFTACKNVIYAWRRGNELKHVYKCPSNNGNVHLMLPFGPHLLTVYENNTIVVWDIKAEEITLEIPFSDFSISTIAHPSTYLNKILLGSYEGSLQLWNLKTKKLIHTFAGWKSPITALEQSPAIHVMAIGLESGEIYIHHLLYDETMMKFLQDWGPVTAISFETDGPPIMASGSTVGHIALWNLEEKRLHGEIRNAHKRSVTGMKFLANEPILVTSSPDNTLKMWEMPDEGGSLLRYRDGHSETPLKIRFHGLTGKNILSAGLDSTLRSFSTEADNLNKSLGQASYNRKVAKRKGVKYDPGKMPPITDFASEVTREKEWDNIAAIHRRLGIVTTWNYDCCRMGQHKLLHERFRGKSNTEAVCVTISTCGNFVIIGYNTGHIDKFNLQSGLHRGSLGKEKAHDGVVRGLATDQLDQIVISGGSDKCLKFWKFKDHSLTSSLKLECSISKLVTHREGGMIAVALDNFSIVVADEKPEIIRKFENHEGSITDMAFSPDSRWLIVASMDSAIRIWDLPSGRLLDWFMVSPICISLTMSSTGEYLATSHAGDIGIYLWSNSTLFSNVSLHPLPADYKPSLLDLPLVSLDGKNVDVEESEVMEEEESDVPEFKSPEQIADELVTLSLLPQSRWLNLLDLDIIKRRNKPREPIKVPKNAPFFLPVTTGLKPTFFIEETEDWKKESEKSKVFQVMQRGSEFCELLKQSDQSQSYGSVIETMKSYNPSKIDIEIRCLSPDNGGSIYLMECFLKAMYEEMQTKKNFEIVHSYIALFFQIHYETIAAEETLRNMVEKLRDLKTWEELQEKMNFCLCLGNYIRSAIL